jgi:hypothetical protein
MAFDRLTASHLLTHRSEIRIGVDNCFLKGVTQVWTGAKARLLHLILEKKPVRSEPERF